MNRNGTRDACVVGGASLEAIRATRRRHGGVGVLAGEILAACPRDRAPGLLRRPGRRSTPGQSFGSLSNLVTRDDRGGVGRRCRPLRVARLHPCGSGDHGTAHASGPQLRHLGHPAGRANTRLRCQSIMDIPWQEMFAPRDHRPDVRAVRRGVGRVEAIWFRSPTAVAQDLVADAGEAAGVTRGLRPLQLLLHRQPPEPLTDLLGQVAGGIQAATPAFGVGQLAAVQAGLALTDTDDLGLVQGRAVLSAAHHDAGHRRGGGGRHRSARTSSGSSTSSRPGTTAGCARGAGEVPGQRALRGADVQGRRRCEGWSGRSAGPPNLSAVRPRPDHPEWDTCIWMNVVTLPGTPGAAEYFARNGTLDGAALFGRLRDVPVRVGEGLGLHRSGGYRDDEWLGQTLPAAYTTGIPASGNFAAARASLNAHDPHRVFANSFTIGCCRSSAAYSAAAAAWP